MPANLTAGSAPGCHRVAVEAYDVRLGIHVDDAALLPAIQEVLPPLSAPIEPPEAEWWISLVRQGSGYCLTSPGEPPAHCLDQATAVLYLENALALTIAAHTERGVAVHAGAVGWRGSALIFPGHSTQGKSTLTRAFLAAGAQYYSDEVAILDDEGRVHAYPRPIAVREYEGAMVHRRRLPVPEGFTGWEPLPLGLILLTHYERQARWRPERISPGQAVLALMEHAVTARTAPERTLHALATAAAAAPVLRSPRGEADETARQVLAWLDAGQPMK